MESFKNDFSDFFGLENNQSFDGYYNPFIDYISSNQKNLNGNLIQNRNYFFIERIKMFFNKELEKSGSHDKMLDEHILKNCTNIIIDDFSPLINNTIIEKVKGLILRNDSSAKIYQEVITLIMEAIEWARLDLNNYFEYNKKVFKEAIRKSLNETYIKANKKFINRINVLCGGVPDWVYYKLFSRYFYLSESELSFSDGTRYKLESEDLVQYYGVDDSLQTHEHNSKIIFNLLQVEAPKELNLRKLLGCFKKYNEKAYVKLSDCIQKEVLKLHFGDICLKNNYCLLFADEDIVYESFLKSFINRFQRRIKPLKKVDYTYLMYPYKKLDNENLIMNGKETFNNFINNYFIDGTEVLNLFTNYDTVLQDYEILDNLRSRNEIKVRDILDFCNEFTWNYAKRLKNFYPDFYSDEYLFSRFYIQLGLARDAYQENVNGFLWGHFSFVLQMIENKFGYKAKHHKDIDHHDEIIGKLNNNLKKYDIRISNNQYKENYLVSLMDYGYATTIQLDLFPYLEQIGDAIYDVAVSKILFQNPKYFGYNAETNFKSMLDNDKREYVSAKKQIKIAKSLGLHEIFLKNNYQIFEKEISNKEETFRNFGREEYKYYADSYEMLIASIYLEFGLEKAYNFATNTFLENYPELNYQSLTIDDKDISSIEKYKTSFINDEFDNYDLADYYELQYPTKLVLLNGFNHIEKPQYYSILVSSLYKLANVLLNNNKTKLERINLVNSYARIIKDEINDVSITSYMVYYFLNYGIETMINVIKDYIK